MPIRVVALSMALSVVAEYAHTLAALNSPIPQSLTPGIPPHSRDICSRHPFTTLTTHYTFTTAVTFTLRDRFQYTMRA